MKSRSRSNSVMIFALTLSFSLPLSLGKPAMAFIPANEMQDLSSNHWAYKAIESLVEKYGVMSGYPDKTFRGSRNMTRYELAASLYKVMTKVEELIAKANKAGTADTNSNDPNVSKEDLETIMLLQKEFRNEIAELKTKVDKLSQKVDKMNFVKINGKVEVKYRDRIAVTDSSKSTSPINTVDVDGDKGKFNFNDPIRNLITEYDRAPFRVKTTLDLSASLTPGLRFYGSFIADDGTIFKLGAFPGYSVAGHFGDEGLVGTSFYVQRSLLSFRSNMEDEVFHNAEKDTLDMKPISSAGTSFYHDNKPGYGVTLGFMNFQNIARTGTKFRNHFNSEKWIGHGYGLLGFGSDDILVKNREEKNSKGETEIFRNSVSRFWATGINVSRVDPDSERYNNVASPSIAFDATVGPFSFFIGGNSGSPYVNRLSALNNNLGSGSTAVVDVPLKPLTTKSVTQEENNFNLKASPSGVVSGLDFVSDAGGGLINEKVVVGSRDVLFARTHQNLLDLPSEYGDGYGLIGVDVDLGWLRFGLNANDYWLDSTFSLSGTRKSFSGVIDIGSNAVGATFQANYNAIGLDTYSAGVFLNGVGGMLDLGVGLKTATRGIFNFGNTTGTNAGFYVVLPRSENSQMPKLMLAVRQTLGDNFGSPKNLAGTELVKVSLFKDSGLTLSASFGRIANTNLNVDLEYNTLVEGPLWGFNVMAHDLALITSYNF